MARNGGGDICEEFSSRMPIRVFNAWMNLAPGQADELAEVGRRYNVAVQANDEATTRETSLKLYDIARAVLAERKRNPLPAESDATSALLAARVDGQALPEEMIVGTIRQVLVVGIIAPTVVIGSIAVHLTRHPEPAGPLAAQSATGGGRAGGVPAALHAVSRLRPHGAASTSRCVDGPSRPVSRSRWCMPRPIATRRCSRTPPASVSTAPT